MSEEKTGKSTKDQVLESAYGLFINHGFKSTSLEEIEEVSGVSVAEIERHFHSKSDVLLNCMLLHMDEMYNLEDFDLDLGLEDDYIDLVVHAVERYYHSIRAVDKDLLYQTYMIQQADPNIHLQMSDKIKELRNKEYLRIVDFLKNIVELRGMVGFDVRVAGRCMALILEGEFVRYMSNSDQTFDEMMRLVREGLEFILKEKLS